MCRTGRDEDGTGGVGIPLRPPLPQLMCIGVAPEPQHLSSVPVCSQDAR